MSANIKITSEDSIKNANSFCHQRAEAQSNSIHHYWLLLQRDVWFLVL